MPDVYVRKYGPLATPTVAIGAAAAGGRTWARLSMVGPTGFIVGLAPLGLGGASVFEDAGIMLGALTHTVRPRP